MIKFSYLTALLLVSSITVAYAQETSGKPAQPAAQGATSVQNNLTSPTGASVKSDGHADKGLTTAETNITAKHKKSSRHRTKAKRAKHAATPDHPAKLERPAKPERPAIPERPAR